MKSPSRSLRLRGLRGKPYRILIERVTPELDGGRYPVKRTVGDTVVVGADILKDGHDVLAARVCYRPEGRKSWRYAPMAYDYDEDRWFGSFVVDAIGRWAYTVEAWTDTFGSWRDALEKRFSAGEDVRSELLEGAALLERVSRRAPRELARKIREKALFLRQENALLLDRVAAATSEELRSWVEQCAERSDLTRYHRELELVVDRERARFAAWYEMFPRSQSPVPGRHGTFADAEKQLPRLADLGFDVVYLPPIHPIGRTHRRGRNNTPEAGPDDPGSPWAIGNEHGGHTAVEPALGTLEDFERFVRAARDLGLEVALDYALQCSPDHPWVREHPEWFFVRPDGTIRYAENPPKKYLDIYPLDFWGPDWPELWRACRDILLFWIDKGVRIFRVDNPHTKPFAFWEWVIREVQSVHPDVIFLSEAFTRPKRMKALAKIGFTQSYTYFTWRNTAAELREYLTELTQTEMAEYFRGNLFTNTPDILHEYLQRGGRPAFRIRLLLAATLSPLYGIYSGFELCENTPLREGSEEYLNSEKYELRWRDWNAPGNISEDIRKLNRIRRENPALQLYTNLRFHHSEYDGILFYRKSTPDGSNHILVAVNLDPHHWHETMVHVPLDALGIAPHEDYVLEDLLTGARYTWRGVRNYVRLDPAEQVGHVFRLVR
ncbi:MAG: alpha-1,4-glucan:maltose-1-phosphate maltosyltransferase [Candidatus Binatia bacterium]|nr:MAG: alpha-1,4-glucan:maltose-1-phosphate maltosyltransferase [Candidatus Binatia bacterium]